MLVILIRLRGGRSKISLCSRRIDKLVQWRDTHIRSQTIAARGTFQFLRGRVAQILLVNSVVGFGRPAAGKCHLMVSLMLSAALVVHWWWQRNQLMLELVINIRCCSACIYHLILQVLRKLESFLGIWGCCSVMLWRGRADSHIVGDKMVKLCTQPTAWDVLRRDSSGGRVVLIVIVLFLSSTTIYSTTICAHLSQNFLYCTLKKQ